MSHTDAPNGLLHGTSSPPTPAYTAMIYITQHSRHENYRSFLTLLFCISPILYYLCTAVSRKAAQQTCACGGIGRRARLRIWCFSIILLSKFPVKIPVFVVVTSFSTSKCIVKKSNHASRIVALKSSNKIATNGNHATKVRNNPDTCK